MLAREILGTPFFTLSWMRFVNDLVSEYRVKDLANVYCCKKYSESRPSCVNVFENCLHYECEQSVCRMVGSRIVLGGEKWNVWVMFCRTNFSTI